MARWYCMHLTRSSHYDWRIQSAEYICRDILWSFCSAWEGKLQAWLLRLCFSCSTWATCNQGFTQFHSSTLPVYVTVVSEGTRNSLTELDFSKFSWGSMPPDSPRKGMLHVPTCHVQLPPPPQPFFLDETLATSQALHYLSCMILVPQADHRWIYIYKA